jgi:hypothetical protein
MAEGESFDSWLAAFSKEVDASLENATDAARATPEARHAREAFDRWWQSEQRSPLEPAPSLAPPAAAAAAPAPVIVPPEAPAPAAEPWSSRVERLADDRARLQQERDAAVRENRELNERLATVQSQIADFEARLSRSREGYEGHIQRLGEQLEAAQAALKAGAETASALAAAEQARRAAEEEAAVQRQRADGADGKLLKEKERAAALEAELARAREELAAQAGAAEELRRQASTYQLRLVQAKEATDVDVTAMRHELKVFLEDLRLIRNSLRKGE